MAMYTMQLKTLIEQVTQDVDNLSNSERIEQGREKLFDFDYPFFSNNYKERFEKNIIGEFYTREIGFETEGLFKFKLEHWLNKNMPYFNGLFESELIKYDPLSNTNISTTHDLKKDTGKDDNRDLDERIDTTSTTDLESERQDKGHSKQDDSASGKQNTKEKGSQDTDSFERRLEGDTPQSRLKLTTKDGKGVLEYASQINEDKGNTSSNTKDSTDTSHTSKSDSDIDTSSETDVDSSEDYVGDNLRKQGDVRRSDEEMMENFIQNRVGKVGSQSYASLVRDYRGAMLRVEVQIHQELQELFMLVY